MERVSRSVIPPEPVGLLPILGLFRSLAIAYLHCYLVRRCFARKFIRLAVRIIYVEALGYTLQDPQRSGRFTLSQKIDLQFKVIALFKNAIGCVLSDQYA